jgi:hypothetical protein
MKEQIVTLYCEISKNSETGENVIMPSGIIMQELKAINKKVEELGWEE